MNSQDASVQVKTLLDGIGGEPLAGSGFEDEPPQSEFIESTSAGVDRTLGRA